MQTDLRGRDFISDLDFSREEIETILDVAFDLKRKRALGEPHAYLRDKVLAMLFFFSSTRTRGSFEAGITRDWGYCRRCSKGGVGGCGHSEHPDEVHEISQSPQLGEGHF